MLYKCINNVCFSSNDSDYKMDYTTHFIIGEIYEMHQSGDLCFVKGAKGEVVFSEYYIEQMFKSVEDLRKKQLDKLFT